MKLSSYYIYIIILVLLFVAYREFQEIMNPPKGVPVEVRDDTYYGEAPDIKDDSRPAYEITGNGEMYIHVESIDNDSSITIVYIPPELIEALDTTGVRPPPIRVPSSREIMLFGNDSDMVQYYRGDNLIMTEVYYHIGEYAGAPPDSVITYGSKYADAAEIADHIWSEDTAGYALADSLMINLVRDTVSWGRIISK